MSCTNCKDSILSQTPYNIGTTKCTGDCPEAITCVDILPSNCVFYSGNNLSCSGIIFGETITSAINKIDSKLCDTQQDSCLLKISRNDTCCGYLQTKLLASSGITLTVGNEGGCETLTIGTNPPTLVWNNISLPIQFQTIFGYQPPQYSNKDNLGRVWFRGSFTTHPSVSIPVGSAPVYLSTTLPVNSTPQYKRVFFNGRASGSNSTSPEFVILPSGAMYVKNTTNYSIDYKGIISLDGLWIDVNLN